MALISLCRREAFGVVQHDQGPLLLARIIIIIPVERDICLLLASSRSRPGRPTDSDLDMRRIIEEITRGTLLGLEICHFLHLLLQELFGLLLKFGILKFFCLTISDVVLILSPSNHLSHTPPFAAGVEKLQSNPFCFRSVWVTCRNSPIGEEDVPPACIFSVVVVISEHPPRSLTRVPFVVFLTLEIFTFLLQIPHQP